MLSNIMQSKATTVDAYLTELPDDRRAAVSKIRQVIKKNLPKGMAEGMSYGMIGYCVPHKLYPAGYHCDPKQPLPYALLASQKNHMSLYLCSLYQNPEDEQWIRGEFAKHGKKLDMGKSCIRFKKVEDLPLEVIGQAITRFPVADFIARYEAMLNGPRPGKKAKGA